MQAGYPRSDRRHSGAGERRVHLRLPRRVVDRAAEERIAREAQVVQLPDRDAVLLELAGFDLLGLRVDRLAAEVQREQRSVQAGDRAMKVARIGPVEVRR